MQHMFAISAAAIVVLVMPPPALAEPELTVRQTYLAGNELRVLVETSRTLKPMLSSSRKTDHVRGWLLVVDTAKNGDLTARSRVLGPLWSIDQAQSMLSFLDGVRFTAADVAAGKARPPTGFDDTGRLVRRIGGGNGAQVLEAIDLTAAPPSWVKVSDAGSVGKVGEDPFEGVVRSTGGRTLAQNEADGAVRVYDLFTGTPKDDPWLVAAFTDYRRRPDFGNSRSWLTDDLAYLVIRPEDMWNKGAGQMIETFTEGGKVYSRAEYGLIYHRPDPTPVLFKRPASDLMFMMKPPHGAISHHGQLLLLNIGPGTLELATPEGTSKFAWTKHESPTWEAQGFVHFTASGERLVFDRLRDPSDQDYSDREVKLVVWDFVKGDLQRVNTRVADLFRIENGEYRPIAPTPVR